MGLNPCSVACWLCIVDQVTYPGLTFLTVNWIIRITKIKALRTAQRTVQLIVILAVATTLTTHSSKLKHLDGF